MSLPRPLPQWASAVAAFLSVQSAVCTQSAFHSIYIAQGLIVPIVRCCTVAGINTCTNFLSSRMSLLLRDSEDILGAVKKLQEFQVPQFMLDKMKIFMRSVQGSGWLIRVVAVVTVVAVPLLM